MHVFPALSLSMGDWDYYAVKMTTRELSESVKFAHEIHDDKTLDTAIQRALNEGRVLDQIVTYLTRQPARFFSSIVIAALGGEPQFHPVEITDDERFSILRADRRLNQTFGMLTFDGTQTYYALDGQHRLAAIRTLMDPGNPVSDQAPDDFGDDEISVLVVVPKPGETHETFMQKYRRLFSNLNRYAKPMDAATTIVMEEDDVFAILTRRLISEHEFFRWEGKQRESARVKAEGSKNLRQHDTYFTSIITLYQMNIRLLRSRERQTGDWSKLKDVIRFRPEDDEIDELYDELTMYWDGILNALPELREDPVRMRNHSCEEEEQEEEEEGQTQDNLLFWPVGQELLADLCRDILDLRLPQPSSPNVEDVNSALELLASLEWRLHQPPWRNMVLISTEDLDRNISWKMVSEDRKNTMRDALLVLRWQAGLDELDEREIEELRLRWSSRLNPAQSPDTEQEMWALIADRP